MWRVVDGLFPQGLIYPDRTPEVLRQDVGAALRRLRDRGPSLHIFTQRPGG